MNQLLHHLLIFFISSCFSGIFAHAKKLIKSLSGCFSSRRRESENSSALARDSREACEYFYQLEQQQQQNNTNSYYRGRRMWFFSRREITSARNLIVRSFFFGYLFLNYFSFHPSPPLPPSLWNFHFAYILSTSGFGPCIFPTMVPFFEFFTQPRMPAFMQLSWQNFVNPTPKF